VLQPASASNMAALVHCAGRAASGLILFMIPSPGVLPSPVRL
jgi:hypothetical protein